MSDLGNKKIMADNIKYYMKKRSIDRKKLSADLGISYTTIASWLQADSYPRIDKIEMMAHYFGINKADLVEKRKPANAMKIDTKKIKYIPLVGTIAMGTPITAEQNIERYIPEFFLDDIPQDELFALHCKGHSMEPTVPNGAVAIIHKQPDVEDDEIAAVLLDDNEDATLKRVKHLGKNILLQPDNRDYDPILLDKDHPGRILGKLIKFEVRFDNK